MNPICLVLIIFLFISIILTFKDYLISCVWNCWASLVAQRLKHLLAMRETWVQSLGREDPLEKEMATHSSILAWSILWTEEPSVLQSMGSQSRTRLSEFTSLMHQWQELL